ncbi:MAG TPA: hypothetical protein VGL94_01845 [Ktedonobacteraceae bacterium]|jgi:hypothetical protein
MDAWYKRKLLQRLGTAWPLSKLRPIDVEEVDTRTWSVLYQHVETAEETTALLFKKDLRRQERLHRFPAFGLDAGRTPALDPMSPPDQTDEPAPTPVVLNLSPDTAYYTIRPTDQDFVPVHLELDTDLQEELNLLKSKAQEQDELIPSRWAFEGHTLFMRDKGGSQFKWILENDKIILCIGRGKKTGVIGQVRLSSEYLQMDCAGDLALALTQVHLFLTTIYGQYISLDMSSLDLAADVLFLDVPSLNLKECFLSRAVLDGERPVQIEDGLVDGPSCIRRRWKKLAGLSFGMHTSPVSAVIYNKTNEIKYHSPEKTWFYDLWQRRAQELGIAFTPEMVVWRVEVRFTRPAFREFPDVSGAYDVLDHLGDLWTYAVGHPGGGEDGLPDGWLRYVIPTDDSNRARWPVHPAWEVIQRACEHEPLPESEYEREEREKEELLQLVDAELAARPFAPSEWSPPANKQPVRREQVHSSVDAPGVANPAETETLKRFVRKRKREVNMEKGIAQIAGWLSTIEAWRRNYAVDRAAAEEEGIEDDISATLHFIAEETDQYLTQRRIDFSQVVQKKQVLYRLESAIA